MNNKNLIVFVDIDATITNVGDRFTSNPPPSETKKDRNNPDYQKWLRDIQTPELLEKDLPVAGTQQLVNAFERSVYLTSRSEIHAKDTLKWLRLHNYPTRTLIMRKHDDVRSYAEMKEEAIINHISTWCIHDNSIPDAYNVIIFDDDPKGKLEIICKKHGWVLFKSVCGGTVL